MPVSDDPFDEVLKPPPNETPEQSQLRLSRETEAKRVSMVIDANIKAERQARRKRRIVRLLLLGQSESGKSTTLRQFQRLYTPTAFREERILWRAVIQLNIVRSIRTILEALSRPTTPFSSPELRAQNTSRVRPSNTSVTYSPPLIPTNDHNVIPANYSNGDGLDIQFSHASASSSPPPPPPPHYPLSLPRRQYSDPDFDPDSDTEFTVANNSADFNHSPRSDPTVSSSVTLATTPFEALKARLLPLQHIEALLIAKLVPPNEEEATRLHAGPSNYQDGMYSDNNVHHHQHHHKRGQHGRGNSQKYNQEIFVRPCASWKGALARARVNCTDYPSSSCGGGGGGDYSSSSSSSNNTTSTSQQQRPMSAGNTGLETPDELQEVLSSCRKDMIQLWNDQGIREILRRKKIRLEDASGFFLDDLERVTSLRYTPSDDDVLKARLKTVGVSEYKFEMEVSAGRDSGTEWRIVDVGGSRSQRPTWAPFFDDVDAIIFLAPISGFDQVLEEDKTINRLEDSVLLWKAVCSNKLLANVDLVLFLNKCDLLEKKLNSGIQLTKYVRSYGDRNNDLNSVSKYLRGKFSAIHREYSPNPRKFYAFCTSVTDTATTAGIIASVRDMVIRQHLKQSKLL